MSSDAERRSYVVWKFGLDRLLDTISDLHGCIGVEFNDLDEESKEVCYMVHTALHHPEIELEG